MANGLDTAKMIAATIAPEETSKRRGFVPKDEHLDDWEELVEKGWLRRGSWRVETAPTGEPRRPKRP
jgi:hypothetical protein